MSNGLRNNQGLRDALIGAIVTVVVLDQITKLVISATFGPDEPRHSTWLLGNWIGFDYVRNKGIAFGVHFGSTFWTITAGVVAFTVIGALFWRFAAGTTLAAIGLGLLLGGGIGNMIDRIRLGSVVDFVAIGPWPRFNIADSAITIGVLILAWCASEQAGGSADQSIDQIVGNGPAEFER